MRVTLSGIVMLVSEVQELNAKLPIIVTLSGIVMLVSEVQESNAELPTVVTLSGIVIHFSEEQESNAELSIIVTLSGIIKLVSLFPDAYFRRAFPFLVYRFPSIDLYLVLSSATVMLVSERQESNT